MAEYLKVFDTHSEYESYIEGSSAILPNVSMCKEAPKVVHYNPWEEKRIVATFNITSTSSSSKILGTDEFQLSNISDIEIDGVHMSTLSETYQFSTTGEHIIKYTLTDNTCIPDYCFAYCPLMTNIIIPKSYNNSMGTNAFVNCTNLSSVTVLSSTPMRGVDWMTFADNASGRKIYVPAESVNTYKSAWDDYAADIEAIPS